MSPVKSQRARLADTSLLTREVSLCLSNALTGPLQYGMSRRIYSNGFVQRLKTFAFIKGLLHSNYLKVDLQVSSRRIFAT